MASLHEPAVITVDNFATKMSPFPPAAPSSKPLYGLVDMGSNGIRFSISDLSPPRSRLLHCIYSERAGISLYEALHEEKPDSNPFHFSEETITKVAGTLARFRSICDAYEVPEDHIQVFATEAMRTARNADAMLSAIKEESGLKVDILSPEMESMFSAMGARSGFHQVNGLFMDLGGGSVQMTYINSEVGGYELLAAKAAQSMPYGAAKLTLELKNASHHGELTRDVKGELRTKMKDRYIYFCGGGFRGYGSMLMHISEIKPYPIPLIGGYTVEGETFKNWPKLVRANDEDGKIFGMSKRRRKKFPAIVTVVQSLVEAIPNINKVIFCTGGNRDGVLYMKLPPQIRESDPIALLPVGVSEQAENVVDSIVQSIKSALSSEYPVIFTNELLRYVARNIWRHMGDSDDVNSTKTLKTPISGVLAGLPGMTHQTTAIIALVMIARWKSDLSTDNLKLRDDLRLLLDGKGFLAEWCDYIGTICRLHAYISPRFPSAEFLEKTINLEGTYAERHDKKGKVASITLKIVLAPSVKPGFDVGEVLKSFEKVGKGGLGKRFRVYAELDNGLHLNSS